MKDTHREMVEEDRVTPWRTRGYMEDNHREMMEEDKEMTPWVTPPDLHSRHCSMARQRFV